MLDVKWVNLKSWHACQYIGEGEDDESVTLCGRYSFGEVVDSLPAEGKGCESCDHILIRLLEAEGSL
jgi:hypothetical protein